MHQLQRRVVCAAAFAAVLASTAGCDGNEPPATPKVSPPAPSTPVTPAPSTDKVTPAAPAAGPAVGGSAIGGVAGGQQRDDAGKNAGQGNAPAPTGGDGTPQPAASDTKRER